MLFWFAWFNLDNGHGERASLTTNTFEKTTTSFSSTKSLHDHETDAPQHSTSSTGTPTILVQGLNHWTLDSKFFVKRDAQDSRGFFFHTLS